MKKLLTYIVIIVFSLIFFLLGAWALLKNEIIGFSWTDQLIQEYAYLKAKKRERKVLILGDSQLEKWPMTHCLYKDLSDFFDEEGIGYLNAAHFGFGPIEYEDQLLQILPDYRPNEILIFYYAGNDLSDVIYRKNNEPKKRTYRVVFEQKEIKTTSSKDIENTNLGFDWDLFEEKGIDPKIIQYAKNRLAHPDEIGPEYVNPNILAVGAWKPD